MKELDQRKEREQEKIQERVNPYSSAQKYMKSDKTSGKTYRGQSNLLLAITNREEKEKSRHTLREKSPPKIIDEKLEG